MPVFARSSPPGRDASSDPLPGSLARAAVSGAAWQGLSYIAGKILVLVSTIILARILAPADFGIVALALVFITYAEVVTDLGVAQAIVYQPREQRRSDAALTLSVMWSVVLIGIATLSAPGVARFFDADITTMFRVLSLSLLFTATGQVPDALLRRELQFRKRIYANLGRTFVQGAVSIGAAVAGAGPWAIVIGQLAGEATWSAAAWALVDYRPSARFWQLDPEVTRPLLGYGVPAAGNALLLSLVFNIDYLIVGRRLGAQALALYTVAFRIPQMAIIQVFYVLSTVAFPVFSRAREEPERLRRGYVTAVRLQTVYGVGAGVGLAMIAPMLVDLVLGPRWTGAIVALEALALYAAFRSLGMGAVDLYKAVGRPGVAVKLSMVRLALLAPLLFFATRWGIEGVAWMQAGVAFVLAVLMQIVSARLLDLPFGRLVAALSPALAVGVGVALGAAAVRVWLDSAEVVRLAAALAAAGAGGLVALWVSNRAFFSEVRALLSRRAAAEGTP